MLSELNNPGQSYKIFVSPRCHPHNQWNAFFTFWFTCILGLLAASYQHAWSYYTGQREFLGWSNHTWLCLLPLSLFVYLSSLFTVKHEARFTLGASKHLFLSKTKSMSWFYLMFLCLSLQLWTFSFPKSNGQKIVFSPRGWCCIPWYTSAWENETRE